MRKFSLLLRVFTSVAFIAGFLLFSWNTAALLFGGVSQVTSLTGIALSNSSFTCGTAGSVGSITVQGIGAIGGATLSLSGADAASFSVSNPTVPSNLTVVASPPGCPRSYAINIVATLAGATGSPFTQPETIAGAAPPSITGVTLANNSFACGTAGSVGAITVQGTGAISGATLSLSGTDAASFSVSNPTVPSNLTVVASPPGCPRSYAINIVATLAGATGSPFSQAETVTGTSAQAVSSIVLSSNTATTNLASGTSVGTLSASLSPPTPTFPYTGTNLHLSTTGTDSGGVCNTTNGAQNSSFQVLSGDQLATNGTLTAGTKNICVTAAATGITALGQALTVTVGNYFDAAASYCATNGGGSGTSASPWHSACIQAATNAAANGDTVFLAAGYWHFDTDADTTFVNIDKGINFIGAGSGNTFDTWGHVNNASGTNMCSGATVTITCIQQGGTIYCLFASTTPPCPVDSTPSGYIQFGSDNFGDTNCAGLNIAHIFWDGSTGYDGGDYQGLFYVRFCNGVTINDIRLLAYNQVAVGQSIGTETQFYPFEDKNVTLTNSVYAEPASSITAGGYGTAQVNQPTEGVTYWGPWNVTNNVFYQQEMNPIYTSNFTFTGNVQYSYNDGLANPPFFYGYGIAGDTLGGSVANYGCQTGGTQTVCNGSWHGNSTNNLFYGPGFTVSVGGSVNDPTTNGGLNDYNFVGNWVIASTAIIAACTANLNGGCPSSGMTINAAVDLNCNLTNDGASFNITNNSLVSTTNSYLDAVGNGNTTCWTTASRSTVSPTTSALTAAGSNTLHFASAPAGIAAGWFVSDQTTPAAIPAGATVLTVSANPTISVNVVSPGVASGDTIQFTTQTEVPSRVYGFNAQQNYLKSATSAGNIYQTNANTISPVQTGNFCTPSPAPASIPGCAISGFTTLPTVSFSLGPLAGSVVPINSPSFTAQYGAVQWLASTSSTTPLSSDARWSSNQTFWSSHSNTLPPSAANSYIPPVSLSGVTHGNTVYMWVMDSANNISAAASALIP